MIGKRTCDICKKLFEYEEVSLMCRECSSGDITRLKALVAKYKKDQEALVEFLKDCSTSHIESRHKYKAKHRLIKLGLLEEE